MKQFQFDQAPDVLLLPSILNRFCGVRTLWGLVAWRVPKAEMRLCALWWLLQRVKDSICINPGQLCKGESGGTFATITLLPLANDKLEATPGDETRHFVPDRTMVEIKRI